jgi:NifU-like protein involved in Fe-S cluster formation
VDTSQLSPAYSATTVDHFRRPRNVGRLDNADAVGTVDDAATENLITIYLRVEAGRVTAARFRTFGCSACIAASSILTELVQGRGLAEAAAIDAATILRELDGLPPTKTHCAALAALALARALQSYSAAG